MLPIPQIIFLFFFPASLAILRQVIWGIELTDRFLALGTFLFCLEQARMAVKDLQQITDAKQQINDSRLGLFFQITISTIFIEIIGFYLSSIWFGWGAILILTSQIWFNSFANLKIDVYPEIILYEWKVQERLPVLVADFCGLILVGFWIKGIASEWIAYGLFGMVILYGGTKVIRRFNQTVF
jgi:hypothetical protein